MGFGCGCVLDNACSVAFLATFGSSGGVCQCFRLVVFSRSYGTDADYGGKESSSE
jgi:hypothetical protein